MKAKLCELQARLDTHERLWLLQAAQNNRQARVEVPFATSYAAENPKRRAPAFNKNIHGILEVADSSSPNDRSLQQLESLTTQHGNMEKDPRAVSEKFDYSEVAQLLYSPLSFQAFSPQPQRSPPPLTGHVCSKLSLTPSQGLPLTDDRFRIHLTHRFNIPRRKFASPDPGQYWPSDCAPQSESLPWLPASHPHSPIESAHSQWPVT